MYLCYVDEAGCTGSLPSPSSPIQPVLLVIGLIIPQENITPITHDFLNFKQQFFRGLGTPSQDYLDWMLNEVKGADLRKLVKKTNRNSQRFAFRVMDHLLTLLERYDAKYIGRVWIKNTGAAFNGRAVYTCSIQHIANGFQALLSNNNRRGFIVADSRDKARNATVSHSIFTQKFKANGDPYNSILEMPVFGHSDNHAGLQLTDLIVSSILYPIATTVYCSGYVTDKTHHHPNYLLIKDRFGKRLKNLQYRYKNVNDKWCGGLKVSDPLGHRNASYMFY